MSSASLLHGLAASLSPWAPAADVNAFFGVATMIIAVPTGVKVFNWLFTLYGGACTSPRRSCVLGFICTFVIGGMTGVLLRHPAGDFVLHKQPFLVAHFHNVSSAGVLFGAFAATPTGFPRRSASSQRAAWPKLVLVLADRLLPRFMPLYALGLMVPRDASALRQAVACSP